MRYFFIVVFSFSFFSGSAQADSIKYRPPYKVNYKWELPVSAVFMAGSSIGFRALEKYSAFTADDVKNLNPQNINAFDRPAAFYDPKGFDQAQKNSDMLLNIAVASPVLLLLDKHIRRDWAMYITLFLETHAVNNALYFAATYAVRRARPLTYNPALAVADKIGDQKSNSFYSGHVAFSAASTFFMAKVLTDIHHITGWRMALIYTAAAIPPALVGYYRMHAGKHFRSDVITGLFAGAACGILIPQLHKPSKKGNKLALAPFYNGDYSGVNMTYNIR